MSRPKRELQKHFVVFCEGDTEYNYIDKLRKKQGVRISIKPINMYGGGYGNFLRKIKTESRANCLAKFIIVDADRIQKHAGEMKKFRDLLEYCGVQNRKGSIPYFLIVNIPDFEYAACLHMEEYHDQDVSNYIRKVLGFEGIEQFKSNKDIYDYLNKDNRSHKIMQNRLQGRKKFIHNHYLIHKKDFEIIIKKTEVDWHLLNQRGSNMDEFFQVIDW